ncbi:MAG: threonine synthase [Bacillota bacterium]|nr:threonine synthase [Bacillota bacterium]
MSIYYHSTRGGEKGVTAAEAILKGIADDGGLFVPMTFPKLDKSLDELKNMTYQETAYYIMSKFYTDFEEQELKECIEKAYDEKFDTEVIAPINNKVGVSFIELFHGPTIAFKDMALSILPHLMKTSAKKLNISKEIVVLTATSGDTGKAALEGFANVEGTKIIVFFPENGVSEIQKRQMVTQVGANTHVIGIDGNFDDAQRGVKEMLTDDNFIKKINENNYMFSSANSINIGRLVPQIVYYFYTYGQMLKSGEITAGDKINVVVPTGNFGNILAAYYGKKMGLPIDKLICASNQNNVLVDFFNTGVYDRNREFVLTISPSMDILISSNLERLIFEITGEDADKTRSFMESLKETGKYEITEDMKARLVDFYGGFATEEETAAAVKNVFEEAQYLLDTHTAVAYSVYKEYAQKTEDKTKTAVASTASPFKFTTSVMKAVDEKYSSFDDFQLLNEMEKLSGVSIPKGIKDIDKKPVLHKTICKKEEMKKAVEAFLNI